ncbi:hypothetical protein EZV62_015051 [Acer yangbiense]|uniref:Endonuclease/exonuclease/phosphatase domain-containing protein n=1 Tax=Acer yangbiense TaxID=1000413 RepID=A0A5C7HUG4_9ROSI|nr:hypothetical protein EZV62_015051 [Acer yangbiense]
MEINEAARNPVLGELASIQEGATGLEDKEGKTMNKKKWKWLAREKCETVSDGNQNLGKRDGDMDVEECSERKSIRCYPPTHDISAVASSQHCNSHENPKLECSGGNLDRIRYSLGCDSGFVVDRIGQGRGLILLWKRDIEVSVRSFTKGHIDPIIKDNDVVGQLIGFYGEPILSFRTHSWEAVEDCALLDMGYVGNKYTWSSTRFKGDLIQEKLDRALCCLEWRTTFPDAIVLHKEWVGSDHKAIVIDKIYKKDPIKGKNRGGGSRFHFEHA